MPFITVLHDAQLHEYQPRLPHATAVAQSRSEGGSVTLHVKLACHRSIGVRHKALFRSAPYV